jgi:hypothetical protein
MAGSSNSRPAIKAIYRGFISIPSNQYQATATVTAVDLTKAEMRFLGCTESGAMARVELTNATTVTARRENGFNTIGANVGWELTEWR